MTTTTAPPRPLILERLALAALLVAAFALALTKVNATDTPWHLATARVAWEGGAWPATNTFSHTHPDYPLFQQYPLYQATIHAVHRAHGWEGLSVAACAGWLAVYALWIAWGGGWRWAAPAVAAWGVALYGLRRRLVLCPDIATQLFLLAILFALDRYASGGRRARWAAFALPVIAWAMANTHQLFTLGLALQLAFLAHLAITRIARGRWGVDATDGALAVWPVALAFAFSLGASLLTPLGTRILEVPAHTYGSLTIHRDQVSEFAFPWTRTNALAALVASAALGATGFALARRVLRPFELFAWLLGLGTALVAIRGVPLFALLSAATFVRNLDRARRASARASFRSSARLLPSAAGRWLRTAAALGTLAFAGHQLHFRWIMPTRALMGEEPGVGRHPACWPTSTLALLGHDPPPGTLLNLGWYAANPLLLDCPQIAVFVDPRFEAYPREFLVEVLRAEGDRRTFEGLIARWNPGWIAIEVNRPAQRERLAELVRRGTWALVAMDGVLAIAVRRAPETVAYLARHPMPASALGPGPALADRPDLYGLQLILAGQFADQLGAPERALELLDEAGRVGADVPEVRRELTLAYLLRGQAALERNQPQAAALDFERALALVPDSADVLLARASARYRTNDLPGALADLDRARAVDRDAPQLSLKRGEILLALDRAGEAELELGAALAADGADISARFLRGVARVKLERYDDALEDLEIARTARPTQWDIWVHKADLLERMGRLPDALAHFEHASKLATDPEAKVKIHDRRASLIRRLRESPGSNR